MWEREQQMGIKGDRLGNNWYKKTQEKAGHQMEK